MVPGKSALAKKNITATEDCFRDHFPKFPIYPGALLVETMAQVGGLLIEKTVDVQTENRVLPVLSVVKKAKFRSAVLPGDSLYVSVVLENYTENGAVIRAKIECDQKVKADATLFFTLLDTKTELGMDTLSDVDMVQDTLERLNEFRKIQKTGRG